MTIDFTRQLDKQIGFLERSIQAFDAGCEDEAIRIAVVVRVLVHNTPKSISLLHHLGADDCKMVTTVMPASPRATFYDGMSLISMGPSGNKVGPMLDDSPYVRIVPVGEWWSQILYVRGDVRLSRKDLVLTAANKDGGAHVDSKLTPAYEELVGGLWTFTSGKELVETRDTDAHLDFLRQIGYEVVNSPGIATLLGRPVPAISERGDVYDSVTILKREIAERLSHMSRSEKKACSKIAFRLLGSQIEFLAHGLTSSEGSASNPLGNYQLGVSRGETGNYEQWTTGLESLGLVRAVQVEDTTPLGHPVNVLLLSVTAKGKDVAAAAFDSGRLRFN